MVTRRGRPRHPDILTPREWEVLELVRQGLNNDEIARKLNVSRNTAKFHVSEIITKLGVTSREEVAAWVPGSRTPWSVAAMAIVTGPLRRLPLGMAIGGGAAVVAAGMAVGVLVWTVAGGPGEQEATNRGASGMVQGEVITPENVGQLQDVWQTRVEGASHVLQRWSSDGRYLSAWGDDAAYLYDTALMEQVNAPTQGRPNIFSIGTRTFVKIVLPSSPSEPTATIEVRDLDDGRLLETLTSGLDRIDVSADGRTLITSEWDSPELIVRDLPGGREKRRLPGLARQNSNGPFAMRFAPDGRKLLWVNWNIVQLQDMVSGKFGPEMVHESWVFLVAASADGSRIVTMTSGNDGSEKALRGESLPPPVFRLWDATTGKKIETLDFSPQETIAFDLSPDGRLIAACARAKLVLWNVEARQQIAEAGGPCRDVKFSPDGRTIATTAREFPITTENRTTGVIHFWRVA